MTRQEFQELRSLIQENRAELGSQIQATRDELGSLIQVNAKGISRNYEMIGRMYERLARVEVGQEQLSHDLRAVAEGVKGNAERIDRLEGHFAS